MKQRFLPPPDDQYIIRNGGLRLFRSTDRDGTSVIHVMPCTVYCKESRDQLFLSVFSFTFSPPENYLFFFFFFFFILSTTIICTSPVRSSLLSCRSHICGVLLLTTVYAYSDALRTLESSLTNLGIGLLSRSSPPERERERHFIHGVLESLCPPYNNRPHFTFSPPLLLISLSSILHTTIAATY